VPKNHAPPVFGYVADALEGGRAPITSMWSKQFYETDPSRDFVCGTAPGEGLLPGASNIYYSITRAPLVRAESMVSPTARAASRLKTTSTLSQCSTGSSPAFSPFRIRST
jgi:hypothetical protein